MTGCHLPVGSIADYDRREAVRAGVAATLDDAWERAAAIRAELEAVYSAASGDDKIAILNDYNSESAVRIADRHCEEVRRQLWAFGNVHESLWAIPGTTETIHIGTKGQRRGYGYVKATHSIIIEPGRSPGAYEMDMIAEEAIAAIAPPVMLLAA